MARWGMPPARRSSAARPVTNIRNTRSPHWRAWLRPGNRCLVPFTSFCEYADTKPLKDANLSSGFDDSRPLAFFAGI